MFQVTQLASLAIGKVDSGNLDVDYYGDARFEIVTIGISSLKVALMISVLLFRGVSRFHSNGIWMYSNR